MWNDWIVHVCFKDPYQLPHDKLTCQMRSEVKWSWYLFFFILFLSSGPHASPLLPWHICSFFISSPTSFCFFFHKMLLSCLLSFTPHICHFHYFIFYFVSLFPCSFWASLWLCAASSCLQCKFTYSPLCSLQLLSVCVSRRWPCLTLPASLTSSQTPTDLPTQAALSSSLLPSRLAFFNWH